MQNQFFTLTKLRAVSSNDYLFLLRTKPVRPEYLCGTSSMTPPPLPGNSGFYIK